MQYDAGSFAAGKGIRFFHSGNGRFCYHHGHRASPVQNHKRQYLRISQYTGLIVLRHQLRACWVGRTKRRVGAAYLARIDLLATERIVVGTHDDGL